MRLWPFVLLSTFETLRQQNTSLKSALHEANKELHKHRILIGGLRTQNPDILNKLEKVLAKPSQSGRAVM